MTVAELIEFLKTQRQDLQVAHQMCSEACVLEADCIGEVQACIARPDGWVQNKRPDMPTQTYLMFPGN